VELQKRVGIRYGLMKAVGSVLHEKMLSTAGIQDTC